MLWAIAAGVPAAGSPVRDSRRSDAFVGVIMSETSPAPLAILFVDF